MHLKICNVQNFSLHDGPGIRTTFFLAGCPLRCAWCHNPETQSVKSTLIYEHKKCISCRACLECENSVHTLDNGIHSLKRENCNACGECVENCPAGALSLSVRPLSREEFNSVVEKQLRTVGKEGGITFSGGEPLTQTDTILQFLDGVDIHTACETCGYADSEVFSRLIDRMDYVMFDVKLADNDAHIKYTGVSNKLILENLRILQKSNKDHIIRTPLIKGITDKKENLDAIERLVGNSKWEKLPYNEITPYKYERIGKEYTL